MEIKDLVSIHCPPTSIGQVQASGTALRSEKTDQGVDLKAQVPDLLNLRRPSSGLDLHEQAEALIDGNSVSQSAILILDTALP